MTPPSSSAAGSPEASAFAATSTSCAGTARRCGSPGTGPGAAPSDHDASAGSSSVATPPAMAAAIASLASRPTSSGRVQSRIHDETFRATVTMSDPSGASNSR
jgi:hypothetical protein